MGIASHEWVTFLGQWARSPIRMASLVPSGTQLGKLMATAIPPGVRRVVEVGAGTGAITSALFKSGIPVDSLLIVELSQILGDHLRRRFPSAHIKCGDACSLVSLVDSTAEFCSGQIDAVVSSLGLQLMSRELQRNVCVAAFSVMRPGGVFIQFTYGPRPPLDAEICREMGLQVKRDGLAWCNLPPARVYVYTAAHSI